MYWRQSHRFLFQSANIGPQDVPRTSLSNIPRTSPKDSIWPSRNVPVWRSGDVPNWCPGDVLKWRPWDFSGKLIWDVPRTFSGCPLEDLQSTQTLMSKFCLTFLSEFIRLTKSKSISTLKIYWEPSQTSKMEHFLQN